MCAKHKCDVLLMQETHRGPTFPKPNISGMELIIERPHEKYGSAIFARPGLNILSAAFTEFNNVEILTIRTSKFSVTSVYKPPGEDFAFKEPENFSYNEINFILGDFNCHGTAWGYRETDDNGRQLELWADRGHLQLIHDAKLPPSFVSARWRRGYNPDNIFVSSKVAAQCKKEVGDAIPRSQHKPIFCSFGALIKPEETIFKRRFNFKKAKWEKFARKLDNWVESVPPVPENYDVFINIVKMVSRRTIPRGCRNHYVHGLTADSVPLLNRYQKLYEEDPFSDDTHEAGERLLTAIAEERTSRWCNLLENLNMAQNSRPAWQLLKNLSQDPTERTNKFPNVTANQVASQLLKNGKSKMEKQLEQKEKKRKVNHERGRNQSAK